jgi:capsular exopolysaccharide synthesis family protein
MSKIFEALQRLERESGKLLPATLAEPQEALQDVEHASGSAAPFENGRPGVDEFDEVSAVTAARSRSNAVEPAFGLEQIPVENVTISPASRIVYYTDPNSPGADRFRLLRMRLWPLWESGKLKTILITSAQAQDGKSTIALNLATALAEHGQRSVLLIEGDLYHPSLAVRLGVRNRAGLAECLEDGRDPLLLIRRVDPLGLYLLQAGQPHGNPTELLQSAVLSNIFDALRPCFDWILVDTPPVVPLTDTLSLRQHADAGLLVVRADTTPRDAVEAAIGRLGTQHLLGLILNGSDEFERLYADYRKSYGPKSREQGKRPKG